MNRQSAAGAFALAVLAYFLGLYQVTPAYLYTKYAANQKAQPVQQQSAQSPTPVRQSRITPVISQPGSAMTAETQPTPWPAPEGWTQR